jgi:ketosteroid isomerase-like protein
MQQNEEAADIAAISQFYDSFNASVQAGEGADGYVKFVSEDAVMMPPNELPVMGREAIRNWVAPILDQFDLSGDPVVQEMLVAGDLAYRRYTVSASFTPKAGGDPIPFDHKYVDVLRRVKGNWRIHVHMWSSNTAAPSISHQADR